MSAARGRWQSRPDPPPVARPNFATAKPPTRAETPNVRWFEPDEDMSADVHLSGECGRLVHELAAQLPYAARFVAAGIDPPTRIIFSGPSGTGKTLTARWLGWKLGLPVAIADISQVVQPHLGETSAAIGALFGVVNSGNAILFLDEIDAICAKRDGVGSSSAGAELARATSTVLQQLDWLKPDRIVIAATNFRGQMDSALARRLPTQVVFELPDRAARARMLTHWLGRSPLSAETLGRLADESDGISGSDLRALAMAEGRRAVIAAYESAPAPSPSSPTPSLLPAPPMRIADGAQGVLKALGEIRP